MNTTAERTKARTNRAPWNSFAALAGLIYKCNHLQNLLLSIYAEHPDLDHEIKDTDGSARIYNEIWAALGDCEDRLIAIKRDFQPKMPATPKEGCEEGGCWSDDDCFGDWICIKGFCKPKNTRI